VSPRRRPPDDPGRAPTERPDDESPETSATTIPRTVTFPPAAWDRDASVITSASTPRPDATPPPETGSADPAIGEAEARRILDARFTAAGVALQADYPFHDGDLVVQLDGYDPVRRTGYAYLSHGDADVVTDFDAATEVAFQELAAAGRAFVLVIHDGDVPTGDALERRIDAFFSALPRS